MKRIGKVTDLSLDSQPISSGLIIAEAVHDLLVTIRCASN